MRRVFAVLGVHVEVALVEALPNASICAAIAATSDSGTGPLAERWWRTFAATSSTCESLDHLLPQRGGSLIAGAGLVVVSSSYIFVTRPTSSAGVECISTRPPFTTSVCGFPCIVNGTSTGFAASLRARRRARPRPASPSSGP